MSSSSTSHQRLVQLEDEEEEKDDVDVKMEQIKGRKVVSIRRVGETTFTEIRRDLFSIIPGVLELRSQPEVYGNHLVTVCCGSNTSCFIGPTRTLFSIVLSSPKRNVHTIYQEELFFVRVVRFS